MVKRRNKPLSVKVTRDGVLTIEIGIDTLAHAALRADFAYEIADPVGGGRPDKKYKISQPRGFAVEVKSELLDEAEDGSSLLTRVIDAACEQAVEQGSQFFVPIDEESAP